MSKSETWMRGWDDAIYDRESDFEDDAYNPPIGDEEAVAEYNRGYDQGEDDYEDVNDIY